MYTAVQLFQPILVDLWLQKDKVRETRTTLLRKNPLPAKEESFWHLPRFEKVWSTCLNSGTPPNLAHMP